MTATGDNGELEYYNVEEYYRVRYTNDRMYLLNFERTMDEIFRAENDDFMRIIYSLEYVRPMWNIRVMRPEVFSVL